MPSEWLSWSLLACNLSKMCFKTESWHPQDTPEMPYYSTAAVCIVLTLCYNLCVTFSDQAPSTTGSSPTCHTPDIYSPNFQLNISENRPTPAESSSHATSLSRSLSKLIMVEYLIYQCWF